MLYAIKKLFYLEGLYVWLGGRRYFLTPPQLHASTLACSLDLLPQLFPPPSEIGFQLCCSDELSVAAAAQLRVAETATSTTVQQGRRNRSGQSGHGLTNISRKVGVVHGARSCEVATTHATALLMTATAVSLRNSYCKLVKPRVWSRAWLQWPDQ